MIKIIKYESNKSLEDIFQRSQISYEDINEKVKQIIEDVKKNGDSALFKYNKIFDNVEMTSLTVSVEEIDEAYKRIDSKFLETLTLAYDNIKKFHEKQVRNNFFINENISHSSKSLYNKALFLVYIPSSNLKSISIFWFIIANSLLKNAISLSSIIF